MALLVCVGVDEESFREVKRRTKMVGVLANEVNASTLTTEMALRNSEQWALKRYRVWV
jgi:putative transposase